jgi:GNAT superfamily N-acetyltransferase
MHQWQGISYRLRLATSADEPILRELIAHSVRELGANDYSRQQIDAALAGAFGVDTALIRDRTYFVVVNATGEIAGCGGWSRRKTLFGSDARADRDEGFLDPDRDAARIRAFFIHPDHARRGLGRLILERCEMEASEAGFAALELMATLPGRRLYEQCGYLPDEPIEYPVGDGEVIMFVPMRKQVTRAIA